jgi:hypothetical protein
LWPKIKERVAGVPLQPTFYCLGTVTASCWLHLSNEPEKNRAGKANEFTWMLAATWKKKVEPSF